METTALLYLFIILLAVFGILLSLLMLKYLSLVKSFKTDKEQEDSKQANNASQVAAKLAQADNEARKIIEAAYTKAQQVSSDTVSFAQKEHSLAQEVYDKVIQAEIEQLKKDIELSRTKSIEVLNNASQMATKEVRQLVADSGEVMEKQTGEIALNLKKELEASLAKTEAEFANYKKLRMEQFEADLAKITSMLATDVLKKEIKLEDHKKFVSEAVSKFKKDVLSNN